MFSISKLEMHLVEGPDIELLTYDGKKKKKAQHLAGFEPMALR